MDTKKHWTEHTLYNIRKTRRQPPVWMEINILWGRCWCGKPRDMWTGNQRRYCSTGHKFWWNDHIHPYWGMVRQHVLERDKHACRRCGASENLHIDHVTPHALGGEFWDMENMQVLCEACHIPKSTSELKDIRRHHRTASRITRNHSLEPFLGTF